MKSVLREGETSGKNDLKKWKKHEFRGKNKRRNENKSQTNDNKPFKDEESGVEHKKRHKRKNKRKLDLNIDSTLEFENESKIRELENRIADNEWMNNPSSVLDYERLVVTNSGSSVVWIAYMSFYLNSGDLEMARKIVNRGLKSIDFREMGEKLNLWVAYLNMECIYGDKVMEVFNKAVQYNDSKTIYLKMIGILVSNNQFEKAKEICEKGIKKFYTSKKIWLAYLKLFYEHIKDFEAGRQLHKTCISRIPQRKRLFITSSTALLEYKYGSPEMGKMYFENILLDNPKRMDIWNQYLTAHIKLQVNDTLTPKSERLKNVRNLFERAISLDLKPKKMKIIFAKWLDFECTHGNEKSKQMVQNKALKYVEYMEKKLPS
ncbi:pre-rRNA processing protein [Theileria orientalis]|uniref:Pre-rRNA processing protein n=1 Tax=Theileria orientalis TaxID=68886 RepID=A0A976QWF2_THEOR|nr:pre-rRNA processing protein [Theileria orientalis]